MFRKPAVIMPAALPEAREVGGEAHQRHEQHVRDERLGPGGGLEYAEGADLKIAFVIGVGVAGEAHRGVAGGKAGQGDGVPGFVEEAGIAACGRLAGGGVVEADHRLVPDPCEQRGRGAMEQQAADRNGQRGDMRAARGAKLLAQGGFGGCGHCFKR